MGVSNDAQVYETGGPDVAELNLHYRETVSELEHFINQCRDNFDDRRNSWHGKTQDLRRHGADALPWEGSSDSESMVISERINAYVSLCMFALERAHIRAYPVEVGDAARHAEAVRALAAPRGGFAREGGRRSEAGGEKPPPPPVPESMGNNAMKS